MNKGLQRIISTPKNDKRTKPEGDYLTKLFIYELETNLLVNMIAYDSIYYQH